MTSFDRIAQHYRWMEALTFGKALQRCRTRFISQLNDSNRVLIFGEGDGRFVEHLLKSNLKARVDVVDSSAAMLDLVRKRVAKLGSEYFSRLQLYHADALSFELPQKYDAIVTNFFLDCLTDAQLEILVSRCVQALKPHGLWVLSDFAIPKGAMQPLAKLLVRALYLAFSILTNLKVKRLPNVEKPMLEAGLVRREHQTSFGGILSAELWRLDC